MEDRTIQFRRMTGDEPVITVSTNGYLGSCSICEYYRRKDC